MWDFNHKEIWVLKNCCFWTLVLEKTLSSPLDCKEIKLVNPKWNQSRIFIGMDWCWNWSSNTLATLCEEPTHWKIPWCWEIWKQEEKGTTEDETVGWYHWLSGHEFEQAPVVGDGLGSLACCSHGVAKSQTWLSKWTELNWTEGYYLGAASLASSGRNRAPFLMLTLTPLYFYLFTRVPPTLGLTLGGEALCPSCSL